MVVPCEDDDGILEDGTCQYGFPATMAENITALEVWGDINLLGWEAARDLRNLGALNDDAREDLAEKIRVLAVEAAKIQGEEIEQQRAESSRGG